MLSLMRKRDPAKNYARVKAWRTKNKDKVNAQARRYTKKHPEKRQATRQRFRKIHAAELLPQEAEQARQRRAADPEHARDIWQSAIARRLAKREAECGRKRPERCELCGGVPHGGQRAEIVWDHDPVTGKFRGWLCHRCNRVLGAVKDSPELLCKMITYLENKGHEPQQTAQPSC